MFLDSELTKIRAAKEALAKRSAMRRMMVALDAVEARAGVRGAVAGVRAGLAVAELLRDLLSGGKKRDC